VQGTAESLPFRSDSFDALIALDLLEHLDDDVVGAAEMCRVLRPRGRLVVSSVHTNGSGDRKTLSAIIAGDTAAGARTGSADRWLS